MFSADYKWKHDYVGLAFDTGFQFEKHKSDTSDKNKISSIDIDRVIEERDFGTIEKFIPCVTKFVLDSEQAQVLDETFVKTFRLCQLSIQYLIYCKKYLDNSLVAANDEVKKLKEECKELNLFVDDLKSHIETLMKEIDEKPTFKCAQCNKIFSTDEFLKSHIKRRHTVLVEAEADQLQMEIKELKGRLNNAEKMIKKEQETDANIAKETELKKIEEMQQKFEDLRLQVQSELKILQSQHNLQEKWFEKMIGGGDFLRRRESTTQTDIDQDFQEMTPNVVSKFNEKDKENVPEICNARKQMTEFGESLESKVTSSLQKIENQMQSFWNKLNDMERYRRKSEDYEKPKQPLVKTRTKATLVDLVKSEDSTLTKEPVEATKSESETNSEQSAEVEKKNPVPVTTVAAQMKKSPQKLKTIEKIASAVQVAEVDEDTTTSETIASEIPDSHKEEEKKKPVKPQPIPRKRPHPSADKQSSLDVIDEELLKHFKIEVEKIIMARVQDLGVSPEWKGLPTRSFNRAMEIVNHQANLMKKTYPNFDFISTQIEKNVTRKLEETNLKKERSKVIKAKLKKVETKTERSLSPKIEIKNRKMYDTDSDTESRAPVRENLRQFSAPYSAVIEELKAVTSKIESDKSEVNVKEMPKEDQTKGVLKSYPSVGSLTKKKVIFNLNTDDDEEEKRDISSKEGGSSTSIASSVFDQTPRKEQDKKKDKEKDIEDLSDFDFSDM